MNHDNIIIIIILIFSTYTYSTLHSITIFGMYFLIQKKHRENEGTNR
jgi:hypothetical protein